jgi:hypothetical protein
MLKIIQQLVSRVEKYSKVLVSLVVTLIIKTTNFIGAIVVESIRFITFYGIFILIVMFLLSTFKYRDYMTSFLCIIGSAVFTYINKSTCMSSNSSKRR